jgi:hypothetical protein
VLGEVVNRGVTQLSDEASRQGEKDSVLCVAARRLSREDVVATVGEKSAGPGIGS